MTSHNKQHVRSLKITPCYEKKETMDECELLGEVHDGRDARKKDRKPQTPIGKFYHERRYVRITHWCKACRRWHGPECFYDVAEEKKP